MLQKDCEILSNDVLKWSSDDVKQWLLIEGFQDFINIIEPHDVSGIDLLMLSEQDWRDLMSKYELETPQSNPSGFSKSRNQVVTSKNSPPSTIRLRRFLFKVNNLKISQAGHLSPDVGFCLGLHGWPYASSASAKVISTRKFSTNSTLLNNSEIPLDANEVHKTSQKPKEDEAMDIQNLRDYVMCPNCHQIRMQKKTEIPKERWKTIMAFLYVLLVSWWTAFVMVVVHDRVPDMEKYPPLPDILLDNIPLIPGAFEMCELCGMVLMCIWVIVLIFHKHRWVLMRRFFSLSGTIYLLRSVTMLITSLSVPGKHLECAPRPYGDIYNKLYNAFVIWTGAGLTLQGVRTCGDYMFSGHTVGLTLLNFFITEYTSHIYMLHTFTWVCNLFGVFFILAAHEHYSIDVFVAFYIASRLFMYYHTLANQKLPTYYNVISTKEDGSKKLELNGHSPKYDDEDEQKQILQFWFPLFTFFESGIEGGRIPNVFEYPFHISDFKAVKDWIVSNFKRMFDGNPCNKAKEQTYMNQDINLLSKSNHDYDDSQKSETKFNVARKRFKKKV